MGAKKGDFLGSMVRRLGDAGSLLITPDNTTLVKESHEHCLLKLNQTFDLDLGVKVDWDILPLNLNQWKMPHSELKKGMFNLYYYPLEAALDCVLKTKTDRKEISKHLEVIELRPNDHLGYEVLFKKDKLIIKKNFTADFLSAPHFQKMKKVAADLEKILNPQTKKHPKA